MEAAIEATSHPDRPYLLLIDEINRADLAKVLGEAIFLLEPWRPAVFLNYRMILAHFCIRS